MKDRGKGITAPEWWLKLVRDKIDDDDLGLVDLGKALAALIERATPYSHTVLSRLVDAEKPPKTTTQELALAISRRYGISRLFYEARSPDEALGMEAIARAYDPRASAPTDAVRIARKEEPLRRLEGFTTSKLDHSSALASPDEVGGPSRRRGRRSDRSS